MVRQIDVAKFYCVCGHISTAPASLNRIDHEMDVYSAYNPTPTPNTDPATKSQTPTIYQKQDISQTVSNLQALHTTNTFSVDVVGNNQQVIKIARSYAVVGYQSDADVTISDHIRLDCPNCGKTLYEVHWK